MVWASGQTRLLLPRNFVENVMRHGRSNDGRPFPRSSVSARAGMAGGRRPQPTAFFTRASIFFSTAGVSSFSAKEVGHISPSSRFAVSLKPSVLYLALNL